MTTSPRLTNPLLLALCMIFALRAEARGADSLRWTPEWGAELTTEQQVTTTGHYNCANLLRLQASLPIAGGFSLDVGSLSTFMTAKESIGDDLQTFSNLDAPRIPFALSVCGVNWNTGDRHSLFVGIRNMNEDYFCSPVTSLFTGSSCGIFPTISANFTIANYPEASVGVHYRFEKKTKTSVSDTFVFQSSLYNGLGSHHFSGRDNVFRFCPKDDGLFGLAEASYNRRGSSYFVGTAVYWGGRSLYNNRGVEDDNRGVNLSPWAYAEQRITDRLSLIAGYSHAFVTSPLSGGLRGAACRDFAGLGGRYAWERAELGLFTNYANFAEGSEWATELTCKVDLTPYLFLQPSVHLIATPDVRADFSQRRTHNFQGAGTLRLGIAF